MGSKLKSKALKGMESKFEDCLLNLIAYKSLGTLMTVFSLEL